MYALGSLCILGMCLTGCQQQAPRSIQPSSSPPIGLTQSTITSPSSDSDIVYSGEDWEQLQLPFPCSILAFSPDWKWIACRDLPNIWVVLITQGRIGVPSLVAKDRSGTHFSLLGLSPGRSGFVMESWDYSMEPFTSTLWLVQPFDSSQRVRLYESQDPVLVVHWSPDGSHLVLVHDSGEAEMVRGLGTNEQSVIPIKHSLRLVSTVAWSPSGDRVFYGGQTKISGTWNFGGWMLNVNSLETTLLFTTTKPFKPSWSPDGEMMVALKRVEAGYDWEMRLLSPAGVFLDTIALPGLQRAGGMKWSPDSVCIALLVAKVGKGDNEVGLVNLSSRQFNTIPVPRLSKIIGWSQDGNAVIVLTFDGLVKKVPVTR
jgi:WD40 repeat protein